ncbi:MAG: TraR/DksA family transcriptional regulator [Spirochaetota bacterium]
MTEQLRRELKSQLEQLRDDLQRNLTAQEAEYNELSGAERIEPVDEAQVRMDSHNREAMRFHDEERLTRVRSALHRMEDGRYGICATCGAEIKENRLRAKPEALFCVECERRREREGGGAPH